MSLIELYRQEFELRFAINQFKEEMYEFGRHDVLLKWRTLSDRTYLSLVEC